MSVDAQTDDASIDTDEQEEMEMRTVCCTARTELVGRNGHTFLQCQECGKSSPKRERVTLDEAQAAFESRQ